MFTVCCPRCFQSLCSFPSIVSSLIALLPPEYPSLSFSPSSFLLRSHTHTHTQSNEHSLAPSQTGQLQKASATQADEKWQLSVSLAGSDNWQMDTAHTHTLRLAHTQTNSYTHTCCRKGGEDREVDSPPALLCSHFERLLLQSDTLSCQLGATSCSHTQFFTQ